MPWDDPIRQGEHVMTVCNACRYCEGYCPVFPAMERRLSFSANDLRYLANLCHNCGECLYACQYAPPHEFGITVPQTLARIRMQSYEDYCWPRALAAAFRQRTAFTAFGLPAAFIALMIVCTAMLGGEGLRSPAGDFYRVMPHGVMVGLFGGVSLFVLIALTASVVRFWRDVSVMPMAPSAGIGRAVLDALTLRHLHGGGGECTDAEETRSPWRRRFHHFTVYGFGLCFASTVVAAVYHGVFEWPAPYPYTSLPVVLGTTGGLGLLIGPAGLLYLRQRRDPALGDPAQRDLDRSFIVLLMMSSLTGLVLLVTRNGAAMGLVLLAHLGFILTLFLTLPYGKFVHGLYRTIALVKYARESAAAAPVDATVRPAPVAPYDLDLAQIPPMLSGQPRAARPVSLNTRS